ncbi:MAG: septation protein A [Alphaproteobacteria bacterium]
MPNLKIILELGPLLAFFITYFFFGIFPATAVIMTATILSLIASMLLFKKLPIMPIVSGVLVMVFGGLTLYLHDPSFIKIKLTIVYTLFAAALGSGLLFGLPLFKIILGETIQLEEEGWRKLTIRWMFFFLTIAVLNEITWRNVPEAWWVTFKTFGVIPLTFLFMMAQMGLLQKYQITEEVCEEGQLK